MGWANIVWINKASQKKKGSVLNKIVIEILINTDPFFLPLFFVFISVLVSLVLNSSNIGSYPHWPWCTGDILKAI